MGLFGSSKTPAVQPAPPTPANDAAAAAERERAADEERRRRLAGGRASTILTGATGVEDSGSAKARTLLGY